MSEAFFTATNVSKSFHGVKALNKVDLSLEKGEIHCLIGENGSGKSTLINIIGGALLADSGTIKIAGKDISGAKPIESIRAGVQIIYQHLSIFPNLTVAENISMNQMLENGQKTVNWKTVREIARKALEEIEEDIDLSAIVEDLPVAKRQIIAISRAVTQNAKLIIMDEATSSLTKEEVDHLFSVILKLKKNGISTLFVSHKFNEVFEISENITVLRDGEIVGTYPTSELDNARLSQIMTGQEISFDPYIYDQSMRGEKPLLEVKNLTRDGEFSDINFQLHKGEILGVVGLIGSGRTEIMQTLFGLHEPDSGQICIDGHMVKLNRPQDAIAKGIAMLPEDRMHQGLFEYKPITSNIIITILDGLLTKFGLLDPRKRQSLGAYWIDKLNIKTPTGEAQVNSLSGGNQQRVVLAKWLATEPKIFILDGPTIGVDIGSKSNIHDIIQGLAKQGMGIIIVSDETQELLDNCNRLILIRNGKIIKEINDPRMTTSEELFDLVSRQQNIQQEVEVRV